MAKKKYRFTVSSVLKHAKQNGLKVYWCEFDGAFAAAQFGSTVSCPFCGAICQPYKKEEHAKD